MKEDASDTVDFKQNFTPPDIKVKYGLNQGKTLFYVNFCYLVNGILQPHRIYLDAVNAIADVTQRKLCAERCLKEIDRQLISGWSADKIRREYSKIK